MTDRETNPWLTATIGALLAWLMTGPTVPRWTIITLLSVLAFLLFLFGWGYFA